MLPKVHLTSHSRVSGSRCMTTPLWLSGSPRSILYTSSVYSCHLFLISPVSVFYCAQAGGKCSLDVYHFLEEISSLSHSISFFYFCAFVHLRRLSYCSLLFSGTLHSVGYIFSLLPSLSSAVCEACLDNHFAYLHFFFFGMVLVPASCTMLRTSVHNSSGILSTRSNPLNLFVTSTV